MGWFSSKEKLHVSTTVQRVFKNSNIPDSAQSGVIQSIFQGGPLTESLQEAILNGPYQRFERMYRYGATDYHYGLPNTKVLDSNSVAATAAIKAAIESDVGQTVTIDYAHFAPVNNVHFAWAYIMLNYGYNPATNELESLSVTKGYPVYLDNIVPTHYFDPVIEESYSDPTTTDRWGHSPESGYTPERPLSSDPDFGQLQVVQTVREGSGETEGAEIHYIWVDGAGAVQKEFYFLDLSAVGDSGLGLPGETDSEKEFYQARYHYDPGTGEVVGYWTYEPDPDGLGSHPTLDTFFEVDYTAPGTYFPFIVLMRGGSIRVDPAKSGNPDYQSLDKILGYLGSSNEEMYDNLTGNPDIQYVDQAVMLMAVPCDASNEIERAYLFSFFKQVYENNTTEAPRTLNEYTDWQRDYPYDPIAIVFRDADFKMVLSCNGITKQVVGGVLGPIGTVTSVIEAITLTAGETNLGRTNNNGGVKFSYRKQVTSALYEEYTVYNPIARYAVYGGKTIAGAGGDNKLLVPIDRELAREMTLLDREKLYYRSLRFVFNAHQIQTIEWYETEAFQIILQIIAFIISVITGQWQVFAAATGLRAFLWEVIKFLIKMYIVSYLTYKIVEVIGIELAFILALIGFMTGGIKAFNSIGIDAPADMGFAQSLITYSNGLVNGINKVAFEEIQQETNDLETLINEGEKEIERATKLLESQKLIDPYVFIGLEPLYIAGETPTDMYTRTIHTGNVGTLAFDLIEHYVDASLQLPTFDASVGDTFS